MRLHHSSPQGAKPKRDVIADILASIKERRREGGFAEKGCKLDAEA